MEIENINKLSKEQLISEYIALYNSIHKNDSILELYCTLNKFVKNMSEQISNTSIKLERG